MIGLILGEGTSALRFQLDIVFRLVPPRPYLPKSEIRKVTWDGVLIFEERPVYRFSRGPRSRYRSTRSSGTLMRYNMNTISMSLPFCLIHAFF